ncbi:MAG TPA: polysaccharide biosynthesis protein [Methylococcaceae bacterium]|nr:polysaccharide biosynthesis protein [Methylococcaceae bacterium]
MIRAVTQVVSISRLAKQGMLTLSDSFLLVFSVISAFSLQQGAWFWPADNWNDPLGILILIAPFIAFPIFIYFGLYRSIVRYIEARAASSVGLAVSLYAFIWGLVVFLTGIEGISIAVMLINWLVALLVIGGSRLFARGLLNSHKLKINQNVRPLSRVMIFGAGEAGRQLAHALWFSEEFHLCGFVDDNKKLQGLELMGVPILAMAKLAKFVDQQKVSEILLAIPSASRNERNEIIRRLQHVRVRIRTLPGLSVLVRDQVGIADLHELEIEDLLVRELAVPDESLLQKQVRGSVVLVTGAGGSIGSELCSQILKRAPKILLILELNEFALYSVQRELFSQLKCEVDNENDSSISVRLLPRIIPLLGSVQDEGRLNILVQAWKPQVIFHAAAYKHVPIVEHNPAEGLKNNVFGTLAVAKVAINHEVPNFILVSTDKAVHPTNIMGASKRLSEMILQALAAEHSITFKSMDSSVTTIRRTHLSMVRFGNVLNSSGSVIPLFRKQIYEGGPVTLTHKEVTRYFMTIPEAAQLVMQAGAMSGKEDGAEVFVLDMGGAVKILDLARRMIEMSGFRVKDMDCPDGDIAIEVTGLRPGEKLFEELLMGDNVQLTEHPRIIKAHEEFIEWKYLETYLDALRLTIERNDIEGMQLILQKIVKGYRPHEEVMDWVDMERTRYIPSKQKH